MSETESTPRTPGLEERLREIEFEIEAAEVNGCSVDRIDYLAEEARELVAMVRALLGAAPSGEPSDRAVAALNRAHEFFMAEWGRWLDRDTPEMANQYRAHIDGLAELGRLAGALNIVDAAHDALAAAPREQPEPPRRTIKPSMDTGSLDRDEVRAAVRGEPPAPGETREPFNVEGSEIMARLDRAIAPTGEAARLAEGIDQIMQMYGQEDKAASADAMYDHAARLLRGERASESCDMCCGATVEIRPEYPGGPRRKVCPTCLADRMAMIDRMASPDQGRAYTDRRDEG